MRAWSAMHCGLTSHRKVHMEIAGSGAYYTSCANNHLLWSPMHLVTNFAHQGCKAVTPPPQAYSLDGVSESLKKAYKLFTDGKFSNALQAFNQMLWTIPLVVVSSRKEVDEVKELITICRLATLVAQGYVTIRLCNMQSCCVVESLAVSY